LLAVGGLDEWSIFEFSGVWDLVEQLVGYALTHLSFNLLVEDGGQFGELFEQIFVRLAEVRKLFLLFEARLLGRNLVT